MENSEESNRIEISKGLTKCLEDSLDVLNNLISQKADSDRIIAQSNNYGKSLSLAEKYFDTHDLRLKKDNLLKEWEYKTGYRRNLSEPRKRRFA